MMCSIRTFSLFILLLIPVTLATAQPPNPDVQTVVAEGFGGGEDSLRARDDAINDALRRAVEQAVGTFVDAGTLTENYELIADKILTKAGGYVRSYKILSEEEIDGVLQITIRADVITAPIQNDLIALELLKQRLGYPRVMVIGTEHIDGQPSDSRNVATAIENFLAGKGVDLVDAEFVELGKARDVALAVDDFVQAQALGQRFGAEVIITYKANADHTGSEIIYGNLFEKYRANVTTRIVKVDTAALMASVSESDIGAAGSRPSGARKAMENTGSTMAPTILDKTVEAWQRDVEGGTRLELIVQGIDFRTSNDIFLALQEARNITSVGQPQMVKDTVTYQLKGSLQGFGLAQRLIELYPDLEISEVTQNRVKATAKK
jgi:hypothetical protein